MRAVSIGLVVLVSLGGAGLARPQAAPDGQRPYEEPFRPQFHFTPPAHWMNDPNGMVYLDGEYHLFYQYHPYSNVWGPMHWGHAVSGDLVHWRNLPIALYPDRFGMVFSGSVVVDASETSGFGRHGQAPLVAMYTSHDERRKKSGATGYQAQGLAYSADRGRTWVKYAGNPVLTNPAVADFRDPKLLWYAPARTWIAVLAVGDHVAFYSSPDLKQWHHESDFGRGAGAHAGVWECPDLIPMTVSGTVERRYVLLVSVGKGGPNGGSATQYFIGGFDGHRFQPDPAAATGAASPARWLDYGTDDYAGSTWSGGPTGDERARFIGWMSNWQYATVVPTERWRGGMTLPRELRLVATGRGLALRMLPAPELTRLRRSGDSSGILRPQPVASPLNLTRASGMRSGVLDAGLLELELNLDTRGASRVELQFANARGESTVLAIDRAAARYELDRRASGAVDFSPDFPGVQTAPLPVHGGPTSLRIFLDRSSVEVFINAGETVFTALVFPSVPYDTVVLRADSEIRLESGRVYALRSIWRP